MASSGGPLVPSKEEDCMLPGSSPSARRCLLCAVVLYESVVVIVVLCTCYNGKQVLQ